MSIKKIIAMISSSIALILFIFIFLLTSIELVAFDMDFYKKEYQKYSISQTIDISENDLLAVTNHLLDYLRDKNDTLLIKANIKGMDTYVFNSREIEHMVDVKALFKKGYNIRTIALILVVPLLLITYILYPNSWYNYVYKSWIAVASLFIASIMILAIFIIIDFTAVWDQFHYVFFSNDLWQLDPDTDVLIQMVPEGFFYDVVKRAGVFFFSGFCILSILLGSFKLLGRE